MKRLSIAVILSSLSVGCASVPKPLGGEYLPSQPRAVVEAGRNGGPVRWGGSIIAVEPEAERTCIQVLARELGPDARPRLRDPDEGRFVACRAGFYDPEVFTEGREVTVTGIVAAMTTRVVGEYPYTMPEVAADVIYLWPPRVEYRYEPLPPTWALWFGPSWYGWHHHHLWHPRPIHRPRPRRSGRGN
ncbi:Slp family lipoprotein [Pseudofulvimonas gallinarii]|jgi:outer membrane lipoprotein|uniref:Outer membrane lipoprotein n=1 Tax=Pseudofulvimonas gallinarii TaxID=634155 RepID=A0A4S3L1W9_9GAMM|nr:Slp family lipoprotein [Pseudofulvimonas gallinarii]TCT01235.1 outer membrane lipoprotein [Pseudofulvimonas gallinarii]THD14998.1 hypothetical protein B1808_00925 [Pseudofulvimonas gallinarii]